MSLYDKIAMGKQRLPPFSSPDISRNLGNFKRKLVFVDILVDNHYCFALGLTLWHKIDFFDQARYEDSPGILLQLNLDFVFQQRYNEARGGIMFFTKIKMLLGSFLGIAVVFFSSPAWSANIIVGGTGNALGTMRLLAAAYQDQHPETSVIVLPSIGSSGAIRAISHGKIDVGLSSRPFKKDEALLGETAVEYARSPTVIAVSNSMEHDNISIDELVDIYTGKLAKWPSGELIRPIIRQADDDNSRQLKLLSPALKKAVEFADQRRGLLFAATDQETVDKIEKTPGSFGVTCLALILSEKRSIHALKLDGVSPTADNCISGSYPIVKRFYFLLPKDVPAHVAKFLKFVNSSAGEAILEKNGNYIPQ